MTVELTNFRKLGGYPVKGGRIREGLLFRGGQINQLMPDQVNYLKGTLSVARIVDFRSADERTKYPDSMWPTATYEPIDVLVDAKSSGVSIDGMIENAGDIDEVMLATYEQLATSRSAREGYHQFLMELVNNPEPTFFHCFAGKDRTGVAAALILKAAGASDQLIFDDYLKTNQAREKANDLLLSQLADQLSPAQQRAMRKALLVDRSYLARFFETVNQTYGNFDQYLRSGLALPNDFESELKQLYVVPA